MQLRFLRLGHDLHDFVKVVHLVFVEPVSEDSDFVHELLNESIIFVNYFGPHLSLVDFTRFLEFREFALRRRKLGEGVVAFLGNLEFHFCSQFLKTNS